MNSFKLITFEDLDLSPEDAAFILKGSQAFLAPRPDPEDAERFLVDTPPAPANLST